MIFVKKSAQMFPSLKMWVIKILMLVVGLMLWFRLFLNRQGTKRGLEKALTTMLEFVSNQSFSKPWLIPISMIFKTTEKFAYTKESTYTFSTKARRKSPLLFQKIPPQPESLVLWLKAPSQLHLFYLWLGGYQMTSLILGALGGWIVTPKALMREKSNIEMGEETFEQKPTNLIWSRIHLIVEMKQGCWLLCLTSFLKNQILYIRKIKKVFKINETCFDLPLM